MRKILVFVVAGALFGAACGSDSKKAGTGERVTATTAASGADLEAKLLTLGDLPAGFAVAESSDEGGEDSGSSGCAELDALEQDEADAEATADFERNNEAQESFQFVNHSVEQYGSAAEADTDFDETVAALQKCRSFTSTESDGTQVTGSFTQLSFPKLEDDTFAVNMTATYAGEGQSVTFEGALVAVRSGELTVVLMSLNYGAGALSTAEFESLVRKAVAKL